METVDEGRVERMASGGISSHQDQETNDEKSSEQSKPGNDTAFSQEQDHQLTRTFKDRI